MSEQGHVPGGMICAVKGDRDRIWRHLSRGSAMVGTSWLGTSAHNNETGARQHSRGRFHLLLPAAGVTTQGQASQHGMQGRGALLLLLLDQGTPRYESSF
jgi:hypothetical protein